MDRAVELFKLCIIAANMNKCVDVVRFRSVL